MRSEHTEGTQTGRSLPATPFNDRLSSVARAFSPYSRKRTRPVENPKDCIYLVVNVNLLEPAYASIRSHEFVVVGVTRGDPKVSSRNPDGASRSNIALDLGDGVKQWTLGQPSRVMVFSAVS